MKKWLLIAFLFLYPCFGIAQVQYNLTSYKRGNSYRISSSSPKKKQPIVDGFDLSSKMSFHGSNLFSKRYTKDTITFGDFGPGIPWPFLHYKISPFIALEVSVTGRAYFLDKHLFLETGIEWLNTRYQIEKVLGSHISYNYGIMAMDSSYNPAVVSTVQKVSSTWNELQIPILIGVHYKFLSFSFGTQRGFYHWFKRVYIADIGENFYSSGFSKRPHNGREFNPVFNFSASIINRKFKLSPFISYRSRQLFVGTEVGWAFKK